MREERRYTSHSHIRMMIGRHAVDDITHFSFVYNPGTEWHAKFEGIQRHDSLGHSLSGIVEEVRPRVGPEPVLHILILTVK